jgi:hypothetical protein
LYMTSQNQTRALPYLGIIATGWHSLCVRVFALLLIVLMSSGVSLAYSVLTHEEIVDLLWTDEIRPLLLKRFPELTEEQLKEAHAYAYGGAVIQDLGYYPFGSTEFSTWCITFEAETSFASCCFKARMPTSMLSQWELWHTMHPI